MVLSFHEPLTHSLNYPTEACHLETFTMLSFFKDASLNASPFFSRGDHLLGLTVIDLSKLTTILYQNISRQNHAEKIVKYLSKLYILLAARRRPSPRDLQQLGSARSGGRPRASGGGTADCRASFLLPTFQTEERRAVASRGGVATRPHRGCVCTAPAP